MSRDLIVEADGGSRGNPGPAAYGALVRDRPGGEVLAEAAEAIGIATNNVAEYRGLIAGLEMAQKLGVSTLEVRMDSKLVVEQMAGRWKIKHPDMKPLALRAMRLVPPDTVWTWIPRERNKDADGLLNEVLDGGPPVYRIRTPGEPQPPEAEEADPQKAPTVIALHAGAAPEGATLLEPVQTLGQVRSVRDKLLRTYAGTTAQLYADEWTIALLVTQVLGGRQEMAGRLEIAPGSVTELKWPADGHGVVRLS